MTRPHLIGLTGSIGTGKTTTSEIFAAEGIPVWSADTAVQDLYGPDAPGTNAIAEIHPEAVTEKGVNRDTLRQAITVNPDILQKIETAIHPLVQTHRENFIAIHTDPILAFEIPLLFETSAEPQFDTIVTITTTPEIQRARVLARPGMTETQLDTILSRQLPDAEKRARADHVIDTSFGLEPVRAAVKDILARIRNQPIA